MHLMNMDTLEFEPRALRMRGECDTNHVPVDAFTALHVHGAKEQERRLGHSASRKSAGRQSFEMTACCQPFSNNRKASITSQMLPEAVIVVLVIRFVARLAPQYLLKSLIKYRPTRKCISRE
jgi:hypothetical protein